MLSQVSFRGIVGVGDNVGVAVAVGVDVAVGVGVNVVTSTQLTSVGFSIVVPTCQYFLPLTIINFSSLSPGSIIGHAGSSESTFIFVLDFQGLT